MADIITAKSALLILKEVSSFGIKFVEKKRNERLMEFYQNLYDGNVTQEKIDYETENIKANEEQYFILLNLSITDEEKEKTDIYSNIYRYIRNNQHIDKKLKTKYIRLAKNLPFSAIELIPLIYIYNKYKKTQTKTLDQYLKEIENINKYEVNLLLQYDILNDEKTNMYRSTIPFKINETFLNEIINVFFKEKDLLPRTQGINIWEKNSFLFVDINDKFDEINGYLSDLLNKNQIELSGNSNLSALQGYVNQKNIICVLTKRKMDIETIKILKKYANTHNIIKICFEKKIDDQLSEIKSGLIYLEKGNEDFENLFISKFI